LIKYEQQKMLNQHEGNNVLIAFRAKVAGLITVGKNSFLA